MDRFINLPDLLKKKSFFLFGPRSVGKSWLIKNQISHDALVLNLLNTDLYTRFLSSHSELRQAAKAIGNNKLIVIDEIQKIPGLLDEVHYLIEEENFRFLLTGSSARKLKKNRVNLLAGRAWRAELFPLTYNEIVSNKVNFDLKHYLQVGGLPQVYLSSDPNEELIAYVNTYLKEEIMQEALVRNLPAFSRFLKTVAISDGQMINYSAIANDAQVPPSTIREYFAILEDTLIGFTIPAWHYSKKRKAIQTAKFFLFDTGVSNTLREIESIPRNSEIFGLRFEQFIAMEIRAYLSYQRKRLTLNYWHSINGQEVDFVIGEEVAIEVKANNNISKRHLKGLLALKEEEVFKKYYLISTDKLLREENGITITYWEDFLKKLWKGEIV